MVGCRSTKKGDDYRIINHQGAGTKSPGKCFNALLACCITGPDQFAGLRIQGIQDPRTSQGIDAVPVDGGGGPGTRPGMGIIESGFILMFPDQAAGMDIVAGHQFEFTPLFLGIYPVPPDGK